MHTNQEKTMQSLMGKLHRLQTENRVQLTPEEAELFQVATLDELPPEDDVEPENPIDHGN